MSIPPSDDDRAERMVRDPDRYYADARERADDQVRRAVRPAPGRGRRKLYSRPTPGVVQLSARAVDEQDLDWLVEKLRACGFQVWLDNQGKTVEHDDGILCRYMTVKVTEDKA